MSQNELQAIHHGYSMPFSREHRELHITSNSKSILFTNSEIIFLHRHFKHPMPDKLYKIMKRAQTNKVDEATRRLLEKTTKACEECETFSGLPKSFLVSYPMPGIVLNRVLALDLMWIEKMQFYTFSSPRRI